MRSRTLSSRTYRLSWVLHPSPLRTFGLCLASLIYILIIPQVLRFVKHFFLFFFEGEEDYSSSAASAASTSSQRSPAISQKSGYMACSPFLDCALIIPPKARAVYSQNIQIGINIFSHFATHFFLDFLLGVCYNFSGLGGFHGKIPSVIKQRGFFHT